MDGPVLYSKVVDAEGKESREHVAPFPDGFLGSVEQGARLGFRCLFKTRLRILFRSSFDEIDDRARGDHVADPGGVTQFAPLDG